MHGILPSEIARLVLDYLEASSCPEAARIFLETSPDLQECRRVAATGGRFITRVFGLTLINILHTFCDIYGLVQEKLSKIDDDELLRRCGDLYEQVRSLIDGCRGQRFFVNINVPAQPSNQMATAGSPIITSSVRKRRYSGLANREKYNRSSKSQSLPSNNANIEPSPTSQCNGNNVEQLPADELPLTNPSINYKEPQSSLGLACEETSVQCSSTVGEMGNGVQSLQNNDCNRQVSEKGSSSCNVSQNVEKISLEMLNSAPTKYSTGTDTTELLKYSTTEVQTTPYDMIESESEITDEPIENLSLLTKELLNRTEIQERIAENINKAILPTDGLSLKDLSFSECITASECNTSIMTELNNAIKSIVTATQSDPIFEKFFDEIFQPDIEGEQSPDEDARRNTITSNESPNDKSPRTIDKYPTKSESDRENKMVIDDMSANKITQSKNVESNNIEVNTKSISANVPTAGASAVPQPTTTTTTTTTATTAAATITTTTTTTSTVVTTIENQALDDFNAAAVQSIINANNKLSNERVIETEPSTNKLLKCPQYDFSSANSTPDINSVTQRSIPDENSPSNHQDAQSDNKNLENKRSPNSSPIRKKSTRKLSKVNRQKQKTTSSALRQLALTETIVSVPTLVVCNRDEINMASTTLPVQLFNNIETTNGVCVGQKSQFIPIAPKDSNSIGTSTGTLYLRTVNVAKKVSSVNVNVVKNKTEQKLQNSITPIENSKEIQSNIEGITLYGSSENNLGEVLDPTDLPTINVEESVTLSDSGLSPYLKFHKKIPQCLNAEESTEKNSVDESATIRITDCDITKRTPRSLLKSRSMNHRLSLSTPRRKNGHIRALDFNTPPKEINSSRRLSEADACPYPKKSLDNPKPMCRTSLFKSPLFETSLHDEQNNSRVSYSNKMSSADSSPIPKLYGGWDKVSGVGTILGCSTSVTSSSSIQSLPPLNSDKTSATIPQQHGQQLKTKKSWDADLRQSLDLHDTEKKPQSKLRKRNIKSNADEIIVTTPMAKKPEILLQHKSYENELSPIHESSNSIYNITTSLKTINVDKKGITKKYAKLKTLATNIKRIDNNRQNKSSVMICSEAIEKSVESAKALSQNSSNITIELETPRKNEMSLGVPPTPRVLSPNHSTSFIQVTEDSGKVRCFITTPEFPPTPCINLTPRQTLENTADITNPDFSAPYFHPISELKEIPNAQSQNERDDVKYNKPEITQFEVIKDNLPKDKACKDLNISINPKELEISQPIKNKLMNKNDTSENSKINKSLENSGTTISDSSDSESDTSSSSCSSSCCSCTDNTTNNSSRMSTNRQSKDTVEKNDTHSSMIDSIPRIINKTSDEKLGNSCERIDRQIARVTPLDNTPYDQEKISQNENLMWKKNELSPEKVFPIIKTQEALDDVETETPIKNDALLCEAEISETPSGSKSGVEILTNLTSKISAIMVENESHSQKSLDKFRKLATNISTNNAKSNILDSLINCQNVKKLENESLSYKEVCDGEKNPNKISQQKEKSRDKGGKIKSVVIHEKCPPKLRSKSNTQHTEQLNNENSPIKSKKETELNTDMENPLNEKNKIEEKIMYEASETMEDFGNNIKDMSDKLSVDALTVKPNYPKKSKLFTANNNLNIETFSAVHEKIKENSSGTSKVELSVLESLKLVPTNKSEAEENPEIHSTKSSQHCLKDFSFVHDDAVNTKRRNIKKFSASDLEFAIQLRNDEFATMTATRFEILFSLPSKIVRTRQSRKVKSEAKPEIKPTKPTIRSIKIVKGVTIPKNNRLSPISTTSQPLATSSPVQIDITQKASGKIKLTNENTDDLIKTKNSKQETKKQSMTTRKRKERAESKDDEPLEKKIAVTNPEVLLRRVNIDEFLTTVHGPVTES